MQYNLQNIKIWDRLLSLLVLLGYLTVSAFILIEKSEGIV